MHTIEVISKQTALTRAMRLKENAFAIAKAFGTLPGYCQEKLCRQYVDYAALTQLKDSEQAIMIDGECARQLTEMEVEGKTIIAKMCSTNLINAFIQNDLLHLQYQDGIVEYFSFDEDNECWVFQSNSLGTRIKPNHGIYN